MAEIAAWLRTVPIFLSRDLDLSERFYVLNLGFTLRGCYDDYLIVSRDETELHFSLVPDLNRLTNSCQAYVRVRGIERIFEQCRNQGVLSAEAILRHQPWGMKEFYVLDPDHNLLKFGEQIAP